ncbi:glycoside hydrolase family 55 protein [Atractiella rhizophila]|nr:glycoside hydrolase family 55 protein [Atractiella rhizophila]
MWDTHVRIGGAYGTNLRYSQCQKQRNNGNDCIAANMGLHITSGGSGYFENNWIWTADHDIEDKDQRQIDVYVPRGVLVESAKGPVWLVGTGSEHNTLYQFNVAGASNVFMGNEILAWAKLSPITKA